MVIVDEKSILRNDGFFNIQQSTISVTEQKPTVISLFTCGMGMDLGFEAAKFETVYANDITEFAYNTITKNKPKVACDLDDIGKIESNDIKQKAGIKGSPDVIIGGPPCQSFSTAGMRRGLEDKRGIALLEFIRVIDDLKPKFFVFENVPGLLSIAKKNIGFYDRVSMKKSDIPSESKGGSLFKEILQEFHSLKGYKISEPTILNAADYGVAQKRKRLILIGSRVADPDKIMNKIIEKASHADPKIADEQGKKEWRTLRDEIGKLKEKNPEHTQFPQSWRKYLKYVKPGGCWKDIPEKLQKEAMGGAANSDDPKRKGKQGGRTGFYRKLSWDKPAPTLVTSPSQLATCICHPEHDRPLTVKEYAMIQGFPDKHEFVGSISQKYRMIGEAVPVKLAQVIAKTIHEELEK